jgi:hypothetical protein
MELPLRGKEEEEMLMWKQTQKEAKKVQVAYKTITSSMPVLFLV